jgi:hypothetical protein
MDTVNAYEGSNHATTAKWVQITDKNSLSVLKNNVKELAIQIQFKNMNRNQL